MLPYEKSQRIKSNGGKGKEALKDRYGDNIPGKGTAYQTYVMVKKLDIHREK